MPIIWRDQMRVGNDLIDQDHRYLVCLFNCLELSLGREDSRELLPSLFGQLLEYTQTHFDREERIQLKANYQHYMEHKLQHQNIIEHLDEINRQLQRCLESAEGEVEFPINLEVMALAREWVIDHIIKTDRDMIPMLKKLPKNFQ
ncbi:hemerythrin family protein [Magnetovirga frankeli]|uniref:bacteriohemerythrin n=1 Tax=Magnetovirga frankeli TaxID=947516 RepID=UPI0012931754|nr:hemerythrin family protein [gamma proteobacterium SS-5]